MESRSNVSAADEFARLIGIMARLRTDCPWDRSQTHHTLRPYLLEEAYEVLEALDREDPEELREELGDLMLQIVFHSELAEETGRFDMEDVLRTINEKLVRRHPHVFADGDAATPAEVYHRWERIKAHEEKKSSALEGVPAALPALVKAARILAKVRQTGIDPFEEKNAADEVRALLDRVAAGSPGSDPPRAAHAVGMLALAVAELARECGVDAEDALRETLTRFTDAFQGEEKGLRQAGRTFADLPPDERRAAGGRILRRTEEPGQ
jgi:tetrapyrrole methylase family protein/MazG family protein